MAQQRKPTPPYEYQVEDRGYRTPCWIWQRGMHAKGYGLVHVYSRNSKDGWITRLAHVVYWERGHGPVPEGMELDHLCKQRGCVNPDHLEPVTHTENIRRGGSCALSPSVAAEIRASAEPTRILATRYGVAMSQIQRVRANVVWHDPTLPVTTRPHVRIPREVRQSAEFTVQPATELAERYGVSVKYIRRLQREAQR